MYRKCCLIVVLSLFIIGGICKADSLEINNGSLPETLLSIASSNNLNVVLAPEIKGDITISLQNMTPREMLRAIALGNNLNYEEVNNIIYFRPNVNAKKLRNLELNYYDLDLAAKTAELVLGKDSKAKKGESKSVSPSVVINSYNNTISFYASDDEYEKVKNQLLHRDNAPKQVALEAKIVALEKSVSKDLGVDWSWSEIPSANPLLGRDNSANKYYDEQEKNPAINNYGTALAFGKNITGLPYEIGITAKLNALITHGKADVLAKPNITTLQGQEAVINIGGEVPVQTTTIGDHTTTTSVIYRPAGIILRCKPRVNEPGIITVEVHTEVSNPSYIKDLKAFRFQKRSADTVVRLKQGETMVIGGLINQDEINNMWGVPLLSKIPLLGNLFKHVQKSKHSTEVMLFLTAREVE